MLFLLHTTSLTLTLKRKKNQTLWQNLVSLLKEIFNCILEKFQDGTPRFSGFHVYGEVPQSEVIEVPFLIEVIEVPVLVAINSRLAAVKGTDF